MKCQSEVSDVFNWFSILVSVLPLVIDYLLRLWMLLWLSVVSLMINSMSYY